MLRESKVLERGRKGVLSQLPKRIREKLSYVWMSANSLEVAYFKFVNMVGDVVEVDEKKLFVHYTEKAVDEYLVVDRGFKDSSQLYLARLVDGMEEMAKYGIVSGTSPFENVFDIYTEPFIEWYGKVGGDKEPIKITRHETAEDIVRCRESARLILLSKIATSYNLMQMGIIPKRKMELV